MRKVLLGVLALVLLTSVPAFADSVKIGFKRRKLKKPESGIRQQKSREAPC